MQKKHEKARAVAKAGTTSISNLIAHSILGVWGNLITVVRCKSVLPPREVTLGGSISRHAGMRFATITHEPQDHITLTLDPTVWSHATTSQLEAAKACFAQFLRYAERQTPGGWFAWIADVSDHQGLHYHMMGSLGSGDRNLKIKALTQRWLALTGSKNPKMLRTKAAPDRAWHFLKKRIKVVSKRTRLKAVEPQLYGINRPTNAGVPQSPVMYTITEEKLRDINRMLEREVYASNVKRFRKLTQRDLYSLTQCPREVVNKVIRIAKKGMK